MADDKSTYKIEILTGANTAGAESAEDALKKVNQEAEKLDGKTVAPEVDVSKVEAAGIEAKKSTDEVKKLDETDVKIDVDSSDIEKAGEAAAEAESSFDALKVGATTAALAGLLEYHKRVQAAVALSSELVNFASEFDIDPSKFQIIGNVVESMGRTLPQLGNAFKFINKNSQEALSGNEKLLGSFEDLGVSLDDLQKKSADEIFLKIADGVQQSSDRSKAYADTLRVLGDDAGRLFGVLEKGSKTIEEMGRSKGFFSKEDIESLAQANAALEKLDNRITIFAGRSAAAISTVFDTAEIEGWNRTLGIVYDAWAQKIGINTEAFSRLGTAYDKIIGTTGTMDRESRNAAAALAEASKNAKSFAAVAPDLLPLATTLERIAQAANKNEDALRRQLAQMDAVQRKADELADLDMAIELAKVDAGSAPDSEKLKAKSDIRKKYAQQGFERDQAADREKITANRQAVNQNNSQVANVDRQVRYWQDMLKESQTRSPEERQALKIESPEAIVKRLNELLPAQQNASEAAVSANQALLTEIRNLTQAISQRSTVFGKTQELSKITDTTAITGAKEKEDAKRKAEAEKKRKEAEQARGPLTPEQKVIAAAEGLLSGQATGRGTLSMERASEMAQALNNLKDGVQGGEMNVLVEAVHNFLQSAAGRLSLLTDENRKRADDIMKLGSQIKQNPQR